MSSNFSNGLKLDEFYRFIQNSKNAGWSNVCRGCFTGTWAKIQLKLC